MAPDDRAAMKAAFPAHAFMLIVKGGWQAIVAIPRDQDTPEKCDAVTLWHASTVTLR